MPQERQLCSLLLAQSSILLVNNLVMLCKITVVNDQISLIHREIIAHPSLIILQLHRYASCRRGLRPDLEPFKEQKHCLLGQLLERLVAISDHGIVREPEGSAVMAGAAHCELDA